MHTQLPLMVMEAADMWLRTELGPGSHEPWHSFAHYDNFGVGAFGTEASRKRVLDLFSFQPPLLYLGLEIQNRNCRNYWQQWVSYTELAV